MKTKANNLRTLDEFKDEHYGKPGTKKREALETGYEHFKIGILIQDARVEKGLTQNHPKKTSLPQ